ncbi:hypothetical protein F5B22DRAFT_260631 [Xylaria bambusicola]|uniref:uncharacterized protein n=1 Tax=Xylaria bambusicola TaxID=326684 RepID=UPI002007C511|nr:uncharacterized protein F5B22DRAFT_260631 [Xylaria bambusicola]KAI0525925.1 hypothetical protein F5B22DRAFT_260631 [Xylaria bambusicola]
MAVPPGVVTEALLDITITSLSPEPEFQRGRKRRRDFFDVNPRTTIPSTESATFRGRCRYRSSSRYLDMSSRPTSQHRHGAVLTVGATNARERNASASPSPSRRKMIRLTELAGHRRPRSMSPSRSRSPCASLRSGAALLPAPQQRRRHRTQSRSRVHRALPVGLEMMSCSEDGRVTTAVETVVLPVTTYGLAMPVGEVRAESDERRE